jgi:NarL family two-component system sensor histidine kinase LiaS
MQSTSADHGAAHTTVAATQTGKRKFLWISGLQLRMTLSYILVTTVAVLVVEGLNLALLAIVSSAVLPDQASQVLMPIVREQAEVYALEAQVQASGPTLNPSSTFLPGEPGTLAPPDVGAPFAIAYTPSPGARPTVGSQQLVALLITPSGRVLASSSPARFPLQGAVATLLPARSALIAAALAGRAATASDLSPAATVLYVAEPVWSRDHVPIGAVFVQMPALPLHAALFQSLYPLSFLGSIFTVGLVLLFLPVVGGAFGTLTTRGLVRRVQVLAAATRQVTDGNYAERVRVTRADELGQLEHHFNQMAAQLDDSLRQRQALAEQNARLAERARISREMHDAVSQDLFSLRMLADGLRPLLPQQGDIQRHLLTLEQTTERMTRGLRALLLELRPPELDHLGLADALESLAALYRTRLSIAVTTHIAPLTLPHMIEHALLRIAQEALANAARHADATAITLDLAPTGSGDSEGVELTVHDDGHGFDATDANAQFGLGLRLMRERVAEVSGTLALASAPATGTTLTITVPCVPVGGAT